VTISKINTHILIVLLAIFLSSVPVRAQSAAAPAEVKNISQADMDKSKKVLVVYFSRTGNTKKVAEDIAARLDADTERIISTKNLSGCSGLLGILIKTILKKPITIAEPEKSPADYGLVILGTPCWGGKASGPVAAYAGKFKGFFKRVAYFYTSKGTPKKETVITDLETLTGQKGVAGMGFRSDELKPANSGKYEKKLNSFFESISLMN
jgi:flavodoxin